jgi:hypothetical protein
MTGVRDSDKTIIYAVGEDRTQRSCWAQASAAFTSLQNIDALEEQLFARLESGFGDAGRHR